MTTNDVIVALINRQSGLAETDGEFAARLGMSRQSWNFMKHGRQRPGLRALRAIYQAFPDLRPQLVELALPKTASIQAKNCRTVKNTSEESAR